MIKPGRIGRPPNQPTNHTIYGRWEGAQVLLLVLCGLPDLPYMGGRSLPTIFSAHLTILSATQPCIPPLSSLGMRSEDRLITILAFLEPFPHF